MEDQAVPTQAELIADGIDPETGRPLSNGVDLPDGTPADLSKIDSTRPMMSINGVPFGEPD